MTILYQFAAPLTQLVDAWMDKSAPIREMLVLNAVCIFVNASNKVAHCTFQVIVHSSTVINFMKNVSIFTVACDADNACTDPKVCNDAGACGRFLLTLSNSSNFGNINNTTNNINTI